jgi:uncharacterized protein (DUF924 family)
MSPIIPADITLFWSEAGPARWYKKDAAFDAEIRDRFEAAHHGAARGEFADWAATAEGALALLILLDQFPRNLYRGSAHSFAADGLAVRIALAALDAGHDRATPMPTRIFFNIPLDHAEDLGLQSRCCALFEAAGNDEYLRYAVLHRDIIARFGRFPHRNACLGRVSTSEEVEFLAAGGFHG